MEKKIAIPVIGVALLLCLVCARYADRQNVLPEWPDEPTHSETASPEPSDSVTEDPQPSDTGTEDPGPSPSGEEGNGPGEIEDGLGWG